MANTKVALPPSRGAIRTRRDAWITGLSGAGDSIPALSHPAPMVAFQPRAAPAGEGARGHLEARLLGQSDQEAEVVHGEEAQREQLPGDEQVPQVGAVVARARGAVAARVDRLAVAA